MFKKLLPTLFLLLIMNQIHAQTIRDSLIQMDSLLTIDTLEVNAYLMRGNAFKTPGSISVFDGKSLNLADNTNLANTINTIPGISMQSGTYATNRIVIRGMGSRTPFNTNRIRSYLNDIPLTSSDGISSPEEIDIQGLQKIEIIKGPGSALYGSGLGGTINLITPKAGDSGGYLSTQYGSFNTSRTSLNGSVSNKKLSLWGNAHHLQSDGFRENNDYRRTAILTTGQWTESKWAISFTLLLMNAKAGIPSSIGKTLFEENPDAAAPNWLAIQGFKEYTKGVAGISISNQFSPRFSNKITFFGRWNDNYEKRPFNNLDDKSQSAGIRNKLSYQSDKLDIILGMEWIAEQYSWTLDIDELVLNQNAEDRNSLNVFSVANYRPNPKLVLSLAASANHVNYQLTDQFLGNGDQSGSRNFPLIFSPRVGLNYLLKDNWSIFTSAGHGFSMPSPEETLLPAGDVNPNIKAEQGWQYEIGSRIKIPSFQLEIDLSLYRIDLRNLLLTKRITEDIFTGINAGKSKHQGIEASIKSKLFENQKFPGSILASLTYTRSWNEFVDFVDDGIRYDGNELPGIPDQTLNMIFQWKVWRSLEWTIHIQYTGSQYLRDDNTLSYSGFSTGNLKGNYTFSFPNGQQLNLYFGINNISDTRFASMLIVNTVAFGSAEPRYYYPGLPRHYYGGVQLKF